MDVEDFDLKPLRIQRLQEATLEESLVRWWRADWRGERGVPSKELMDAIPVAEKILAECPDDFEDDRIMVSRNDIFNVRQYSMNASAILLASWLTMKPVFVDRLGRTY